MEQNLNQVAILILTMWVAAIGLGFLIAQGRGGWAVFSWPFRITFRFARWAVGGLLVSLGNWIRGG